MLRRFLTAAGVVLVALVVPAAATARITPTQAKRLVLAQHTSAQMVRMLDRLSPADRRYVLKRALSPAHTTFTSTPVRMQNMRARTASGCKWFSKGADFYATVTSSLDVPLYTMKYSWQWGGACVLHWANHQDDGHGDIPGWAFTGSTNGALYGGVGQAMAGRERYGHFSFAKFVITDVIDFQAKVYAGWGQFPDGWWYWWKASGP